MTAKIVEDTAGLVSIGQLAKAAGVSSRTIRYYEELGILPEPRRSPGGTRKYPREYRGYIDTALALKDLGFRLEEIKPLARLALGRSVSAGQRDVAARLVDERIESLGRQVDVLRRLRACVKGPDAATAVPGMLNSVTERESTAELAAVPSLHHDGVA
jgi:DNA-binding transcriptional MerR regulator